MEWIETTAKSVQEAKEQALDKLGVDEAEAEFELLEEPKAGLFGRVRGQARIRARVAPKSPRAKAERNDRRRSKGRKTAEGGDGADGSSNGDHTQPESEATSAPSAAGNAPEAAAPRRRNPKPTEESSVQDVQANVEGFLRGLTDAFGIETTVGSVLTDDAIDAQIDGKHGLLLGPKGRTLEAIQELTRVCAQRTAPSSTRIRVDVGGYREARREALIAFAASAAQRAVQDQVEVALEPMNAADRKIIHDSLGEVEGVSTRSAGNEPRRRVVVVPDKGADGDEAGHDDPDDEIAD